MKDQKKLGISISYVNLILNTIVTIFLTPFMIRMMGDDSYSLYKVMQSFAGPLAMFNLGVSTIVTRAIVKYETEKKFNLIEKQNTIGLAMLTSIIMSILIAFIGFGMCMMIPSLYGNNYSASMIRQGQIIFTICFIYYLSYIK